MRFWTAANSIAQLRGVEQVLLCRFVFRPKDGSFGKFGLDAQQTVADLWLLLHELFCRTGIAGNHFFSVLPIASQGGITFLSHLPVWSNCQMST